MEKEHKQLLQSSVDSVKGLTKSFNRNANESDKQSNVANVARIKSSKQNTDSNGLLQDIKKILEAQFKFTKARDREAEFEADKAKKSAKFKMFESKKMAPRKEGGGILKDMKGGWLKKLGLILLAILAFGSGFIVGVFARMLSIFTWLGKVFPRLGRIFNAIKTFFTKIGKGAKTIFGILAKVLKPVMVIMMKIPVIGRIFKSISNIFKFMKIFFKLGFRLAKAIPGLGWIIMIVMSIFDFIKGFKGTKGNFIQKLMGGLGEIFVGLLGLPLDMLKNAIAWIFKMFGWKKLAAKMKAFSFSDIIRSFFQFIPKLVGLIVGFFKNNPIGKILVSIVKIIFWPITLVINIVKGIINFIKGFIKGFTETEGSLFDKILGGLFGGLKGVWEGIKNFFIGLIKPFLAIPKMIGNIVRGLIDFFKNNDVGKAIGTVVKIIFWPITLIIQVIKNIINFIKGFFKGFKETKGGFFQKLLGGLFGGLKAVWEGIKKFFVGIWDAIVFIPKLIGNIVKGIINFFKNTKFGQILGQILEVVFWPITLIVRAIKGIINLFKRRRKNQEGETKKIGLLGKIFRVLWFVITLPIQLIILAVKGIIKLFKERRNRQEGDTKKVGLLGKIFGFLWFVITLPIRLIILAVKGIISLFKRKKPDGEAKKIGVLGKIFGFLWKVITFPIRMIILAIKTVVNFIGGLIGKIKDFFANNPVGQAIAKVLSTIFKIITWPIQLIKTFLEGFKGTEGGFFQKVIGGLKYVWEKIKGFFANLIPQFIKDFVARLRSGDEASNAMTAVKNVIDKIVGFFHRVSNFFADFKPSEELFRGAQEIRDKGGFGSRMGAGLLGGAAHVLSAIGLQEGGIITKPTVAVLAEDSKPEGVFPLPNLPTAQLSALSGQLALQAAGGMSGVGTGGETNVTTVAPVTTHNTEIYRTEPGVIESTLSKINQ